MILILGSTGYIGSEFVKQLTERNIDFITLNHKDCNELILYSTIKKCTYVINAAGYTGRPNVDSCETHKEETINGNILFVQKIVDICRSENVTLGHISSGCIYLGDGPYTENDKPNFTFKQNNCSFYSGTKAMAEDIVKTYDNSYIWRLRIPFENIHNNRNYISKLLNYTTLLDVKNSISNKQEFVNACIESLVKNIPYGIYNMTNTGYVTTKQVVELMSKTIAKNKTFDFFYSIDDFYNRTKSAPRSNCVLTNDKILSCGIHFKDALDSVKYCLNEWRWK